MGARKVTTHRRWHNRNMDSDGQLALYDRLAARLKEAHARVRTLRLPEGERAALTRKLLVITAASKHDLAAAERRLDRLMTDIDEGRYAAESAPGCNPDGTDGSQQCGDTGADWSS